MIPMIPTVDLESADVSRELVAALSTVGFVELRGHGLGQDAIDELRGQADVFFDLDETTKRSFVHPEPLANRGFRAKGSEALRYSLGHSSPPDLFESFNCGPEVAEWSDLVQPTPWPDAAVPGFRAAAAAQMAHFTELARRLDDLIGAATGVPDLAERSTSGPDMMACIDYRPGADGTEPAVDGQQRMGAHSDYTTFTLLLADPVPGLQIIGGDGGWVDVIPARDSVLVNVGDLLAIWTNDTWPSTLHRVVPMAAGAAARRRSVAYFHYPDLDEVVEPLSSFTTDEPAHYRPVSVADHIRGKLSAPKLHAPAEGASTAADRIV